MNVDKMSDKFNQWNPMENDYKNAEFNHYVAGPGAELDYELQPSQQASQSSSGKISQPTPTLVFKNLPEHMTKFAMHNICSKHGHVINVRDSNKNDYFFVDLATVSDMEAVFRALENNNYGFKIMVSTSQKRKPSDVVSNRNQKFSPIPPSNKGIDYESRNLRTSTKNHPRPKVKEDSPLNSTGASGLSINIFANDVHALERQGLFKVPPNKAFNYHNGRAYMSMPDKIEKFVDKKHNESQGVYNASDDKFICTQKNNPKPSNIRKCSQCGNVCDTVCERCYQYYCSVECQSNDWPNHRYICGKPKHLQKTPPSRTELQIHNMSPKMLKEVIQEAPVTVASKELSSSSKTSSELEHTFKPSCRKIPASLKASKQQPNSLREYQQLSTSSATSMKGVSVEETVPISRTPSLDNPLKASKLESSSPRESQQLSTTSKEQPNSSKSAPKKLPAALRTSSKRLQSSTTEPAQHITESIKADNASENSEIIYKQNMPRSGNIVTITSVIKTNVVFIRSTTYEANFSYFNTVNTLQSLGKLLQPLQTLPKSGDVVIAKFDTQFNRALVLKVNNNANILINFMDFGNAEPVQMEDLYQAPKEFIYKPRHAIPVVLKDVTDFYMTEEVRMFMYTYLNDINVEIRYKPEDFLAGANVYAVELIDESTRQNLNKMIIKLSKPREPRLSDEICDRGYLKSVLLPVGNNIELIVMDNSLMMSGCISCTTKAYAIEIGKFKKDIQDYVESIPREPYTPRVHELCIAQYNEDGFWYRGLCVEVVGDGHPSIHFIDYGNITIVPIENIRRYPRQFTYPMYTFDCVIGGLPEYCCNKIVEKLEDLIPNGEIITCESVTIDEEDKNFYYLVLPNVIKELTKCGLIENGVKAT